MKNQKRIAGASLFLMGVLMLVLPSCSTAPTSAKNCEKLILKDLEDGSIFGAAPARFEGEKMIPPPLFNLDFYRITKIDDVKVIKFGPVPSKEDIRNGKLAGILDEMPQHCKFTVLHKFATSHSPMEGYTAMLAEVSIAEVKPNDYAGKMFRKELAIHEEYLNQITPVWFLGHTITAEREGEKDIYSVEVAGFEDLDYFDNLIEVLE